MRINNTSQASPLGPPYKLHSMPSRCRLPCRRRCAFGPPIKPHLYPLATGLLSAKPRERGPPRPAGAALAGEHAVAESLHWDTPKRAVQARPLDETTTTPSSLGNRRWCKPICPRGECPERARAGEARRRSRSVARSLVRSGGGAIAMEEEERGIYLIVKPAVRHSQCCYSSVVVHVAALLSAACFPSRCLGGRAGRRAAGGGGKGRERGSGQNPLNAPVVHQSSVYSYFTAH